MNIFTALMMTVTLTMATVMVPRIYMSWMIASDCFVEGEIELLKALLVEQNSWVRRQFSCGAMAFVMLWMVKNSHHDLQLPASMEAALGIYATLSLLFAVLESIIAQKIDDFINCVPAPVGVRED